MGLWKRIASRFAGGEEPARRPTVGLTRQDLERDEKELKALRPAEDVPELPRLPRREDADEPMRQGPR